VLSGLSLTERRTKGVSLKQVHLAGLGVMSVAEVQLQEGESLENALRRFKRKVMTEDIIKDVKRHSYYLKTPREASFGAKACPKKGS
jgi:small subunit ribosomal protein S21